MRLINTVVAATRRFWTPDLLSHDLYRCHCKGAADKDFHCKICPPERHAAGRRP